MITRPLDLASKLRPRPRNFDALFLVNGGLIVLFFMIFGSRFVLSPGRRLTGNDLAQGAPSEISYTATSATVTVNASGQIFTREGLVTLPQLEDWLATEAKKSPRSTLLLLLDARVSSGVMAKISGAAQSAGFADVQVAMQPSPGLEPLVPATP